ncbi:NADPH:quinone reductase [Aliiruegeria lutimaris]|uniref:NADPH:quinone reductase n=2 Tax=Aliiruegeria lutimaris TaxID=571298 RepID=A0A1G8L344_9RHOB|nr:NADPH:quinone reductase [Aliiruegeria lutimaris]
MMKAAVYRRYGGPEVVTVEKVARPEPGPGEVLVKVEAAAVTSADWRLRAAAFPSFTALPGRLMFGIFRPRKPVLGGGFAGRVVARGQGSERFEVGQAVVGFSVTGAHAEYVAMPEDGAILERPEALSPEEAASLPFGGLSALVFLRDFARLQPGERVLVVGASGGVGVHAVQIARALGAEVDVVCRAEHASLMRELGAGRVFDYRHEDFAESGKNWDIVIDCVGASSLKASRRALSAQGRFVALNMDWTVLFQALTNWLRRGPKMVTGVSLDKREDLESLLGWVGAGKLRPVVEQVFPLDEIRAAHTALDSRHRAGTLVVTIG